MFPIIGFKYPKRSFKRVVLELPFSPTIDINSFSGKVKFISLIDKVFYRCRKRKDYLSLSNRITPSIIINKLYMDFKSSANNLHFKLAFLFLLSSKLNFPFFQNKLCKK